MDSMEYLKMLPFFDKLSEKECELLTEKLSFREYKKKQIIVCDEPGTMLLVVKGRIMAYAVSEDGKEFLLFSLSEGECAPIATDTMPKPEGFEIVWSAEAGSAAAVIPGFVFEKIFTDSPAVQSAVYNIMLLLSARALEKMGNVIFVSVKKRLARYLYERYKACGCEFFATKEAIAKEIGSAREVVTRILSWYEKEGIVKTGRGKVIVCNKEKIELML